MGGDRSAAPTRRPSPTQVSSSRRRFLGALVVPASAGFLGAPRVGRRRRSRSVSRRSTGSAGAAEPGGFDPGVHGFGFHNWSTANPTYPEHDHDTVTEDQVRRSLPRRWEAYVEGALGFELSDVPSALFDVIAKQVYVAVNQRAATNGHCYGMVFTAQQYFERPESIPLDRWLASEFSNPADPVDDPSVAPVGREIDLFQNSQFLDFHAWVGRRALLKPDWIDYDAQLRNVLAVVDAHGTAGVTLFRSDESTSHQVLVYGYRTTSDRTSLSVYDPNRPASQYRSGDVVRTIEVDTSGERPVVEPYGTKEYDGFVFNRYDRIIAARRSAEPLGAIDRAREAIHHLLFDVALFLVDADVGLTVVGPDGRPLTRLVSPLIDRRSTEYRRMRVRYGADPGRYRVVVTGSRPTEYTLYASAASLDGERLSDRSTASIDAGEVHEYVATVPTSAADDGDLERRSVGGPSITTGAGLVVGAAGIAAGVYALCRRGRSESSDGSDSEEVPEVGTDPAHGREPR